MKPPSPFALPLMMAELAASSWETVLRRTSMMAQGTCSTDEYARMAREKVAAMGDAVAVLARGGSQEDALKPFLRRARANAKRLRKKAVLF